MVIRENTTPHIKIFQSHIHLVFETYEVHKIFYASYFSKADMVKIKIEVLYEMIVLPFLY